jgi:hypothetical protein
MRKFKIMYVTATDNLAVPDQYDLYRLETRYIFFMPLTYWQWIARDEDRDKLKTHADELSRLYDVQQLEGTAKRLSQENKRDTIEFMA